MLRGGGDKKTRNGFTHVLHMWHRCSYMFRTCIPHMFRTCVSVIYKKCDKEVFRRRPSARRRGSSRGGPGGHA